MFEKWTKKISGKITDHAVNGAKESLNDKLDTYSGIIKIGLTLGVIIFGSIKINDHHNKNQVYSANAMPQPQQPIIINNYITDGRRVPYGEQRKYSKKH